MTWTLLIPITLIHAYIFLHFIDIIAVDTFRVIRIQDFPSNTYLKHAQYTYVHDYLPIMMDHP